MRVLVTGGAGYIGSHTLIELLAADHAPLVVDNFANSSPVALERVAQLTNRVFDHVEASITDTAAIRQVCDEFQPEAVIHFAGLKAVGESGQSPLTYYSTNVGGTIELLKAMDGCGCRRMIFSSSATVYGVADYLPFDEKHPLNPVNPYGRTKFFIEEIIRDWAATDPEKSAMLLRYFNPVGAHQSGRIGEDPNGIPDNLMPYIAQVAVGKRDQLTVFGDDYDTPDGTGVRDYIHVNDLASGHLAALDYAARHAGVEAVNLGTGKGHSVLEVIAAFEQAAGRPIPYTVGPRRPGDIASSHATAARAASLLGWQAGISLERMCEDTWRWQSRNPEGYSD